MVSTAFHCNKVTRKVGEGFVIPIGWVSHAVELVPVFGSANIPSTVTATTSQEIYDRFFLNHFADKEIYNSLHGRRTLVEDGSDCAGSLRV